MGRRSLLEVLLLDRPLGMKGEGIMGRHHETEVTHNKTNQTFILSDGFRDGSRGVKEVTTNVSS